MPHPLRNLLIDTESDESLITEFLLGYSDHTCASYLADLRDFHAWCARIGKEHSPTPPSPTFVAPRWRVIPRP